MRFSGFLFLLPLLNTGKIGLLEFILFFVVCVLGVGFILEYG